MTIINIKTKIREDEIFNQLKGKPFFAISVTNNEDGSHNYEWHFNNMNDECAMYACELIKKDILDKINQGK
jgi:hypothetical protein